MIAKTSLSLSILVFTLLSGGCSMMSSAKKSFIEQVAKSTPEQDYLVDSKASQMQLDMQMHLKEWNEVAPELKRLIKMGQDLEYVLGQIDNSEVNDNSNSHLLTNIRNDDKKNDGFSAAEFSYQPKQQIENELASIGADKFSGVPVTEAAIPLMKVNDDKFSGTQVNTPSSKPQIREQAINTDSQTMAYANSHSSDCASLELAATKIRADGANYALHLASYSKRESLKSGMNELKEKFGDSLCGKIALYMPVNVKGNDYYSLRLGPFLGVGEAQNACNDISSANTYCKVTKYEGERVQ